MTLLAAVLLTAACADNDATNTEEPLPEGMGRIRITICTPENNPNLTRAVNDTPWEDPNCEWEWLHDFHILICQESTTQTGKYEVKSIISSANWTEVAHTGDDNVGTSNSMSSTHKSAEVTSEPLIAGDYYIFAVANLADYTNYAKGKIIDPDETVKYTNGYSTTKIPMTGKLMDGANLKKITVNNAKETPAGTITVWRVMAKMQFEFTNESAEQIKILGIEVEPINQASDAGPGIYFFSKDDLESENNLIPLFPSGATKTVSATWALNDTPTQDVAASVSMGNIFEYTKLSWGNKLKAEGSVTTYDNVYTLQKFKTTENVAAKDAAAVITFKIKPKTGMAFTPKNISFKVCRVGTDGGKFDVEAGGNALATGVTPPRSNGDGGNSGNHEPPFYKEYSYAINGTSITNEYVVSIYLYGLNQKEYAFRDVVISGDVTNNTGAALQEHITLPSGALTDTGPVTYTPASNEQTVSANGGTRNLFFYVNETDATYTNNENQLSLRFKIQRGNNAVEEVRYGVTTPYIDGNTGGNGFNVIRRNDWIHIPIHITDWQLRIEPLAFVPIAGYPANTVSSDGLTTTFSTGGMIALQPFVKKYSDATWRDFGDPEVTFVSISWKNSDGTDVFGDGKIVKTAFAYDPVTKSIIGELNNDKVGHNYMTTFVVNVTLGSYGYSFTFNVILQ